MRRASSVFPHDRRIARALGLLEARFGPNVALRLREAMLRQPQECVVSSGSLALDYATGTGGLPRGHLTELVGALLLRQDRTTLRRARRHPAAGGLAALVDAEGTADPAALLACGADLDTLCPRPPRLRHRRPAAPHHPRPLRRARPPRPRQHPRPAPPALRPPPPRPRRRRRPQRRRARPRPPPRARPARPHRRPRRHPHRRRRHQRAGLAPRRYRHPPTPRSTGGLALAHFAALRILVEPLAPLPDPAGGPPGLRVRLTVIKHKLGAPGGTATADLHPGRGLDPAAELLALALARPRHPRLARLPPRRHPARPPPPRRRHRPPRPTPPSPPRLRAALLAAAADHRSPAA